MARRPKSSIPRYKRKTRRPLLRRIVGWIVKILVALILLSVLWVLAYRFVNPPITATMISDMIAGRGAHREWMPIGQVDRDMVRAAIAAEDSKFCSHKGFDMHAIEDAMKRNASGGRIRGGSTISQQTAKNAFLWQNGGYARKAAEAWFTFLIEHLWGKRRIMEVYLNLAETGIGTYGVNAGSQRYYGHDASAMTALEAARIAAVLPLPKERGAIAPRGFTRRYGNTIAARIPIVARDGLDSCLYAGAVAAPKKAPPPVAKVPRPQPGADYEASRTAPPVVNAAPPPPRAPSEPEVVNEPQPALPNPPASDNSLQ
ncbi:MAG: monofunctional biosynthetic peptidoglycan transglycosylase [Sphingomonas sp.]|nr:monofunctional biosynthetic peptidoglycan transglycosylase [Sphingomonas sp.]